MKVERVNVCKFRGRQRHQCRRDESCSAAAFTLVELMISIALMLLLMIGINLIFTMSGRAVSAGQALSEGVRSAQAAQSVMYRDFSNAVVSDAPCILLRSRTQPAFRNAADFLGDHDVNTGAPQTSEILSIDLNGDNTDGDPNIRGETVNPSEMNYRNHRVDILSFFVRDLFYRQTGNDGTIAADQTANEAWVWYGHLGTPNGANALLPVGPGSGTRVSNPDNYYATQWVLGRVAMLMTQAGSDGHIRDRGGLPQAYWLRIPTGPTQVMDPFDYRTTSWDASPARQLVSSRYDLAGTSIDQFRDVISDYIRDVNGRWWPQMMLGDATSEPAPDHEHRFQRSPVLVRPLTSASAAQHAYDFLAGCTQFAVEYAGDFVTQNDQGIVQPDPSSPTGAPLGPDGKIDFIQTGSGTNTQKKIRWFGFPRNVNTTDDLSTGAMIRGQGPQQTLLDVVPFRDFAGRPANFEKELPTTGATGPANYAQTGILSSTSAYTCAWGPSDTKPSMIRITIVLDDPGARLSEGQTFEYVFKLQ